MVMIFVLRAGLPGYDGVPGARGEPGGQKGKLTCERVKYRSIRILQSKYTTSLLNERTGSITLYDRIMTHYIVGLSGFLEHLIEFQMALSWSQLFLMTDTQLFPWLLQDVCGQHNSSFKCVRNLFRESVKETDIANPLDHFKNEFKTCARVTSTILFRVVPWC